MKDKEKSLFYSEEEEQEFNEALTLAKQITKLLERNTSKFSFDKQIYQSTFALALAMTNLAEAAEKVIGDEKGQIKEECMRLTFQMMYRGGYMTDGFNMN